MNRANSWEQLKKEAFEGPLSRLYERDALRAMWRWWLEKRGLVANKHALGGPLQAPDELLVQQLEADVALLLAGMPFQYVINEAWFMGRPYVLNGAVLIPRPETEELVQWILDDFAKVPYLRVVDLGTGSGIIPISLHLTQPDWDVHGLDLSSDALATARENGEKLGAKVNWLLGDMRTYGLPDWDLLVSNPPYIPLQEAETLDVQVRNHEPAMALFAPDEDPLLFYRSIAQRLVHAGAGKTVYLELNHEKAPEIGGLFTGFECTFKADMQGKVRMLRVRT